MKLLIARRTKEIPLWMYYVRCGIDIICSLLNLILLPFGKLCNLNTIWQGRMIRSMRRRRQ